MSRIHGCSSFAGGVVSIPRRSRVVVVVASSRIHVLQLPRRVRLLLLLFRYCLRLTRSLTHVSWHILAIAFGLLFIVAFIQLVRDIARLVECSMSIQRGFLTLTAVIAAARAALFLVLPTTLAAEPFFDVTANASSSAALAALALLPTALNFAMYTSLIRFWVEIIGNARHVSGTFGSTRSRAAYLAANGLFSAVQVGAWLLDVLTDVASRHTLVAVAHVVDAVMFLAAAALFARYGAQLYQLLWRHPIDSEGRRQKLREVSIVAITCTLCFVVRACALLVATFVAIRDVEVIFVLGFFVAVELLPATLVLYALRRVPRRAITIV